MVSRPRGLFGHVEKVSSQEESHCDRRDVEVTNGRHGLVVRRQFNPLWDIQEGTPEEEMGPNEKELLKDLQDRFNQAPLRGLTE
jgi:hypothetical protein